MTEPTWYSSLLRPELSSMRSYVPASAPPGAVRLDANESPWALDPDSRAVLAAELARVDLHRYPDARATELREAVAAHAGSSPSQVVLGCGSDEVIALIINAMSRPREGRERAAVLFPAPSFVMYHVSARGLGVEPVAVPLDDDWDLDVAKTHDAIERHRPSVVFLPSPNNPTGNLFSLDRVAAVIAAAPDALVLLDEAYGAFAGVSYRAQREAHPNVGQLQTLSKVGLAGARVGWAILPEGLGAEVDKVRQPFNLNALSQRAGLLALGPLAPRFDEAVARIVAERERLRARLSEIPGVRVDRSDANFLWVETSSPAGEVFARLFARGVVVRSFDAAGGRLARRLRVTVGTPDENAQFCEALAAAL